MHVTHYLAVLLERGLPLLSKEGLLVCLVGLCRVPLTSSWSLRALCGLGSHKAAGHNFKCFLYQGAMGLQN